MMMGPYRILIGAGWIIWFVGALMTGTAFVLSWPKGLLIAGVVLMVVGFLITRVSLFLRSYLRGKGLLRSIWATIEGPFRFIELFG